MDETSRPSRRSVLVLTGVAASSALLAGCGGPGPGDDGTEEDDGAEPGEGEAPGVDQPEEAEEPPGEEPEEDDPDVEQQEPDEQDDDEADEDDIGDIDEEDIEEDDEWAETDQIVLEAITSHWLGVSPDEIEDEENPTLTLYDGREYEFLIESPENQEHNLALLDEDDEAIESGEFVEEDEDSLSTQIRVVEEMSSYVCENHPDTMRGEIEIRTPE